MLPEADLIVPDWPAPPSVRALQTTRMGGVSLSPYDSLNLGTHVGDQALAVASNRQRLSPFVPSEPVWLEQVHGTRVVRADHAGCLPRADAAISHTPHTVCAVMTADCLPILFCDETGTVVGVAHAGWRGLAAGVIESTVEAMQVAPRAILAWLGPAIGARSFEVGAEVRAQFVEDDHEAANAFVPVPDNSGKYLADLCGLARRRLTRLGIDRVYGGDFCTYSDSRRFYSYRRDGVTGRMATLIWLGQA